MKIVWLRRARRSVELAVNYIARENPQAARMLLIKLRKAPLVLLDHPQLGRPGRIEGTRELIVTGTSYIFAYCVKGSDIEILFLLHTAQAWPDHI